MPKTNPDRYIIYISLLLYLIKCPSTALAQRGQESKTPVQKGKTIFPINGPIVCGFLLSRYFNHYKMLQICDKCWKLPSIEYLSFRAKSEAEGVLNEFHKETETFVKLKKELRMTTEAFLSYLAVRVIAEANSDVYIGLKSPAKTDYGTLKK